MGVGEGGKVVLGIKEKVGVESSAESVLNLNCAAVRMASHARASVSIRSSRVSSPRSGIAAGASSNSSSARGEGVLMESTLL